MKGPSALGFGLRFAGLAALGFLILQASWTAHTMWTVKTATARSLGGVLPLLGTETHVEGAHIYFAGTWIQIIDECTGIYAAVLLSAFVLTFPTRWRRRLVALTVGLVAVVILNVLRLVSLALLMVHAPGAADFAHDYLWQVLWAGLLVAFAVGFTRAPAQTA